MDFEKHTKAEAMEEVIRRFSYLNVFFDESMVKSYTKFSNRDIKDTVGSMLDKGVLDNAKADGVEGYN